jgi:hypothetical protein
MKNDKLQSPSKRVHIVLCSAVVAIAVAAPGAGLAADWSSKAAPSADWSSKVTPNADWSSKVSPNADWSS